MRFSSLMLLFVMSAGFVFATGMVEVQPESEMAPTIAEIAAADGRFDTLVAALDAAGLVDTLSGDGPFTVFAPTDDAFAALPEGTVEALLADIPTLTDILLYHVVSGSVPASAVVNLTQAQTVQGSPVVISTSDGVMVNDASVTQADVTASNGIIHVIDTVILPPAADIVDLAVANGNFETLAAALTAAGLIETLQGDGPFTVFAPTDEAFAALPAGTVASLLADIPTLTDILLYHVVPGLVVSGDVVGLSSATTVQGSDISIAVDGMVMLNDNANVIVTDVLATNGVIHVIDSVILPPGE